MAEPGASKEWGGSSSEKVVVRILDEEVKG